MYEKLFDLLIIMKIQAKKSYHSPPTRWPKLKIFTAASYQTQICAGAVQIGVGTLKNYLAFSTKIEHAHSYEQS